MNWEGIDSYAFETLGQVRTTPVPMDWSQAERDANTRITQTNKSWAVGND